MASDVVYSAVRDYLTANFTAVPLSWENEDFEPAEPPAPFVAVEVYGDSYTQTSIGSGSPSAERWREEGAVLLHVIVPHGTGSLVARQHATTLANLLRGLELPGDIQFRNMSIGLGRTAEDDGAWYMVPVRAEWIRG